MALVAKKLKKKSSSGTIKSKAEAFGELSAKKLSAKKLSAMKLSGKKNIPEPFPIVAFGASAGGLEAFTTILKNLDANLGMAYVFIMHLSPNHKSALTELLQPKTEMPVHTVKNGMQVKQNNVYVIPPNTFMSVVDGHLKLAPRSLNSIGNYAVDYFLIGLANLYKNNAIGVILSGTATDGTLGLKAIKAEGGITFAQDETAKFPGMPGNAKNAGYVDFFLPPQEIAKELSQLIKVPYTVLPSDKIESVQQREINVHREDLKKILSVVKNKTEVDFYLNYKHASIYRRVVRRMVLNKFDKLSDYYSFIKTNPKEVDALFDDFLINVTHFFRDPDFFKTLESKVFPTIIKQRNSIDPIRIWVAGCSTGEEAYSIAICLIEFLEKRKLAIPIQIFASDLDTHAIEKARLGIYPAASLEGVSNNRLKQYFKKIDGHYQVVRPIREICVFSRQNLMKDPPFSRMNLISCQNVLIYLEGNPQKKILQTFHYALKPEGFLFLGKSESIGNEQGLFEAQDKKIKIFSRIPTKSPVLDFTLRSTENPTPSVDQPGIQLPEDQGNFEKEMDKFMLSRFVQPCFVVDKNLMIVQFFGVTSPFLSPGAGKASLSILKMLRDDLIIDVRSLLQQARKTEKIAIKEVIKVYNKRVLQELTIEVIPKTIAAAGLYFLIVFRETASNPTPEIKGKKGKGITDQKDRTIIKLEDELLRSREIIRTTTEEYETTYEELQANNEEILSSNEELQSVNEELETSKEELQSANEELTTTNEEARNRNSELAESHTYAEAIVETMHGPLLVLNTNLQVRMANKHFYNTFHLTEEKTEGVFLYELEDNSWDIPGLRENLKELFLRNSKVKEFEIRHTFPGSGQRVLIVNAYRSAKGDHSRDGLILMAFDDITLRLNTEASLQKSQEQLKLSLIGDSIGTWSWNLTTDELKWSKENENLNGLEAGKFNGRYKDWENLMHPEDVANVKKSIAKSIEEKLPIDIEHRITLPDGSIHWILSKGNIHYDERGKPDRIVGVSMDSTARKMQSESLEHLVDLRTSELITANKDLVYLNEQLEQFVFISSHDLQEPLRKIQTFASFLSGPEANLNDYAKNYADKITASSSRMSILLRDLLSFTLLLKNDDSKMVQVDLNTLVKNILKDFELVIEFEKATINLSPLPTVHAEPVQMNQLFHNLISNALKFSNENLIINITSTEAKDQDFHKHPELKHNKKYFSISINDNGVGFDQQYEAKMFTLFQRLNDKKGVSGTGIGLAICKKIVENHDGFIFAEGEENVGATFTVYLPSN